MAATSSSVPFFGISEEDQYNNQQQQPQHSSSTPSSSAAAAQPGAPQKKKRNLPGNPNPDAEVIALSPKALLATNRFICEVCNKGFKREQNLQLHRRGHNLPWKLKQKNPNEIRRRVYVCPEPTCVHHDPSRALGDLTGIKKHYCRKHGEKKWKCDKCSKRYAVQSDWKAHSKTCGTREYRCDCGTLFSRRDSFITHRAFCDALAQESARIPTGMNTLGSHLYDNNGINLGLPHQVNSQLASLHDQTHASVDLLRLGGNDGATQLDHLAMPSFRQPQPPQSTPFYLGGSSSQDFNEDTQLLQSKPFHGLMQLQDHLQVNTNSASSSSATAASNLFNLRIFANSSNRNTIANNNDAAMNQNSHILISDQFNNASGSNEPATLFAGSLMRNHIDANMSSMYNHFVNNESVSPHMSATALLQKAAQMGATSSCSSPSSLLRGLGSSYASSAKNTSFRAGFDGVREGSAAQVGSETHFQGLVNSLAHGNIGIFSGGNEQETGFNSFGGGMCNMNEDKLQRNLSAGGIGASDRLTRDFLGVGSVMRNMGGGMQQREQHLGIDMDSLRSELKSGSSARSFVGGSLQ